MPGLTTLAFDADDTLWQNLHFYRLTEEHFQSLLADYADPSRLGAALLETERRNLKRYGFGIKGFTLSMVETALEVTEGRAPGHVIARIIEAGREMLAHPVELLPHARETIEAAHGNYKLVLITKGDLFDQERKIAASGLADYFDAVEIVSDKNDITYTRIFQRHGVGSEQAAMIGNSLKSDIVPAIAAGSYGIFVPHEIEWAVEHDDEPVDHARYRRIVNLGELARVLESIDNGRVG